MNYTEEIWEDLTWDEKQTYRLAEEFQSATNNKGIHMKWIPSAESKSFFTYDRDGKYPGDKIRESRNWKYFSEVWDWFKEDDNFDPRIFVDAVFRRLSTAKSIVPAQLRTKANYEYYKEYRMKLKMSDKISDAKQIMIDVTNTYKLLQRKIGKIELEQKDFDKFFNIPKDNSIISEGLFLCIQEMISPYYYCLSKSFLTAWSEADSDIRDEVSSMDRIQNISAIVRSKSNVYNFLKKIYKDDIT